METIQELKTRIGSTIQDFDSRRVMDMYRAEITQGIPIDRLLTICAAERDGRVVVLPCKVGDTVYVDKRTIYDGWRTKGISAKLAIGKVVSFRQNKSSAYMKIKFAFSVGTRTYMHSYVVSAIGETVFLTRAEAEAKGEQK